MSKIKNIFIPVTVTLLIGYIPLYLMEYNVDNNKESIESHLQNQLDDISELEIIKKKRLKPTNTFVFLFKYGDRNGYAKFVKGWNNNFSYQGAGYGTAKLDYDYIKTNKGIYGLLNGENPEKMVKEIKVVQDYGKYKFSKDVSGEEIILEYEKLPNNVESAYPADTRYYDANGNDITLKILRY